MAKNIKGNNKWIISGIILAIIILVSILPSLGLPNIPSWDDAYNKADLNEASPTDNLPFTVHYIDVGQGDCAFIKSKEGTFLIDAGEKGNEEKILSYIKAHGIKSIDYLVATHPHSDHIGSMPKIIEEFEIKNVIMPKLVQSNTPTTKVYENFLLAVKASGAKVIPAVNGDKYKLGDVTFNVLSPSCQSDDLNNMSAVIMLTYKETSFLFMGDAGKEVERQIIANQYDVNADVIKIGHHGSNTATSEDFLKEVSPSLIIIPCGKDNSYGHPHKETVDLINTYKIKYKRTDECGNIVVGSDGKKLTLETEKEAS